MKFINKIASLLSRYLIIGFLALMVGMVATVYTIKQPIDFKLGVTVETPHKEAAWQFYCHENSSYRGEWSSQGYYTSKYEIEPNTYRIKIPIVCGSGATHMRFDPLPDTGEVTIKSMRIHTHD